MSSRIEKVGILTNPDLAQATAGLMRASRNLIEVSRTCCPVVVVSKCGEIQFQNEAMNVVQEKQRDDGGWSDVLETAWALDFLGRKSSTGKLDEDYKKGMAWLEREKTVRGAWGRTSRDISRIPVTGWVLTLLPELADEKSLSWLENEWKKDLNSETKLTYKGALTLMAFAATKARPKDESLIHETIEYLMTEQNEDGGYAPWKGHPVGSEPWSTGIDLLGLTAFPELVKPEVLEMTLDWLGKNQLTNGLWPCHYIEEGSAYCYWGAVEAMKYLKRIGRL